jgi:hypothetical protein
MPSDTRGTDLNSWWSNRAEFRQHSVQGAARLRETGKRLRAAVPGAKRSEEYLFFENETVESILQQADKALAALAKAQAQFPKLTASLESEKGLYQSVTNQVHGAAQQAARARVEKAARDDFQSRRNWLVKQQQTRKIVAAVIFVLVLYVLIQY